MLCVKAKPWLWCGNLKSDSAHGPYPQVRSGMPAHHTACMFDLLTLQYAPLVVFCLDSSRPPLCITYYRQQHPLHIFVALKNCFRNILLLTYSALYEIE